MIQIMSLFFVAGARNVHVYAFFVIVERTCISNEFEVSIFTRPHLHVLSTLKRSTMLIAGFWTALILFARRLILEIWFYFKNNQPNEYNNVILYNIS